MANFTRQWSLPFRVSARQKCLMANDSYRTKNLAGRRVMKLLIISNIAAPALAFRPVELCRSTEQRACSINVVK
jgi:hypothetical protein